MNAIKRELKWWLNSLFFREYRYRRIEKRHLMDAYSPTAAPCYGKERVLVMMNDGRRLHGGLADRLRAIVSFYSLCRDNGLEFRINFTFPFNLSDYLVPNRYDWLPREGEISFNSAVSHPFFTDTIGISGPREIDWELNYIRHNIIGSGFRQMHVYSPFDFVNSDFSELFHELFKPSPRLETALNLHRNILNNSELKMGGYVSVSTRFMELLGDFHEPKAKTVLSEEERVNLIDTCRRRIEMIHESNPGKKILITSDSMRFLEACADFEWGYIVDGKIAHSDTADSTDHLKTFVDFWLVMEADEAYQLRSGAMYAGNFSRKAAMAGGISHHLIEF